MAQDHHHDAQNPIDDEVAKEDVYEIVRNVAPGSVPETTPQPFARPPTEDQPQAPQEERLGDVEKEVKEKIAMKQDVEARRTFLMKLLRISLWDMVVYQEPVSAESSRAESLYQHGGAESLHQHQLQQVF
ncbi:hypothetical protein Dimus_010840 [Dionaea muscipula]